MVVALPVRPVGPILLECGRQCGSAWSGRARSRPAHLRALLAMDGVEVAAVADPALSGPRRLAAEAGAAAYPNHMELLAAERLTPSTSACPAVRPRRPRAGRDRRRAAHAVEKPVAIDQRRPRRSPPAWPDGPWSPAPATTGAGSTSSTGRPTCWRPPGPARPVLLAGQGPPPPGGSAATGRAARRSSRPPTSSTPPEASPATSSSVHAFAAWAASTPTPLVPWARRRRLRLMRMTCRWPVCGSPRERSGTVASTCLLPRLQLAGVQVIADGLSAGAVGDRAAGRGGRPARRLDRRCRSPVPGPTGTSWPRSVVARTGSGCPWPEAYRTHLLACAITRSADEGRPLPVFPDGRGGEGG